MVMFNLVDKAIIYGRVGCAFDPIGGVIRSVDEKWIRIDSEDGLHVVPIADVGHIKYPNEHIEGFVNADI